MSAIEYELDVAKQTFTAPESFRTDLASVPRLPLAYMLFGGVADEAALVHDYLYTTRLVSRKIADEVFAETMKAKGSGRGTGGQCGSACVCSADLTGKSLGQRNLIPQHR
ncbi:DUF1353 domain-containing protein [Noviherbaspirillum sp. Root189]|uniref:DUF1353 domain-containing protein n=1 Tax=Noviherbaspirillum sp. Root189 TaxID=1736487 RepID=UPI00070C5AE8|nr:DUF1353 domain-containing protein [Noviherbaspirillum sp. Root189]KRB83505.1 hypothetical protein ASE07_23900 [Noviherbaspirillum sp. Root189]